MTIQAAKRLRAEKGFTLIELLIVIVVLGILAGIAVFAVGTFTDTAKDNCDAAEETINVVAGEAAEAMGGAASDYLVSGTGGC